MDKNILRSIETIKSKFSITADVLVRLFRGELAANRRVIDALALDGALNVIKDGGYTLSPFRTTPTHGYVVSLKGHEVKYRGVDELVNAADGADILYAVSSYMQARLHVVRDNRSAFFGAWHDKGSDTLYLDVSVIVGDAREAYQIAVANEQLAIYSLEWKESIDCTSPEAFAEGYERLLQREDV